MDNLYLQIVNTCYDRVPSTSLYCLDCFKVIWLTKTKWTYSTQLASYLPSTCMFCKVDFASRLTGGK